MNPYRKTPARSAERFALALPLALASCTGSSFSTGHVDPGAGPGDDSGGGVILVGQEAGHDAGRATDSGMADARHDAHDAAGLDAGPDSSDPDVKDGSPGCPTGMLDCGGSCVADGLTNCGACGHDCSNLAHVSGPTSCAAGGKCAFAPTSCSSGWVDCDGNPDNGCETDTSQSPNCGGCGVACGGNTPACDGTGCASGCSGSKPTLCNGTTCVDTTSDPQNCSACGTACSAGPANSQPTCASSQCGYQCNATFTQCADGTCDDLTTDVANCGACGYDCNAKFPPPPNGTDICSSGSCDFTCAPGFNRCNLDNTCQAPAGVGAYVQVGSGFATSNCGAATSPCPTIQAGIDFALKQRLPMVYVADGTYYESITIATDATLTVQGAWTVTGGTWTRDCPPSVHVLVGAPAGSSQAVLVTGTGNDVTLDSLTVGNESAAAPGQTLYGVFASSGTTVHLKNMLIATANGGAGSVGTSGGASPSPAAPPTCTAGTSLPRQGHVGPSGNGAPPGGYSASGYTAGVGGPGGVGLEGDNGTAAPAPPCDTGNTCTWDYGPPKMCIEEPFTGCATPGTYGCGGYGANGGNPGAGGGSTIGVFAGGANVTLDGPNFAIMVGSGGNGGDGGGSGVVGQGSKGAAGTAAGKATCDFTTCKFTVQLGSPSLPGGDGAAGGPGGQGGGGSGGDAYCYATGGGGTVSVLVGQAGFQCKLATAGLGGNQGAGTSQGAPGNAGVHN